ncbi:GTP cyclohydrolase FolE2 [Poriferisphaera sp. WC338]|uniref:GTP cyclohydrolase FolE2 n=1 Tax=Poriferisphaera sp. WC338 TaxID=3425129 RepID=UPI003D81B481
MTSQSATAAQAMPDVQGSEDSRQIAINKVGVKDIRYPITLKCPKTGGTQSTVANVNMYVGLPHHQKGTHMSRFLEVLNKHHDSIRSDQIMDVCHEMKKRLNAETAHLELTFPYFIDKQAPITGQLGKLDIEVKFTCTSNHHDDMIMEILVPATSLCPCSKEISEYGAHNQRCHMSAQVRLRDGQAMWIEELFEMVERSASTQVFAVLKRPDEKYVTEAAYDNPKFVEDIVRDLAREMEKEDRIKWYSVSSENFESIHNHNAYAVVERDKDE